MGTGCSYRGAIDFDELRDIAHRTHPKIILCGFTSYPRDYDYAAFKQVADILHIAAGIMRNCFDSGFDIVKSFGIDERQAEETLDQIGIITNEQIIPDDPRHPLRPSGIRVATPACITRGFRKTDMEKMAGWMVDALQHPPDSDYLKNIAEDVESFCLNFPVPGINS